MVRPLNRRERIASDAAGAMHFAKNPRFPNEGTALEWMIPKGTC